ncbi:hypothetical protein AVEN_134355-1 [Araneus ventricosus]|uniref:Uncharacterized protein n=1 Tax=Araneus ventricosus TaxID=182803 RepID=A0A4Y2J6B3_ARAVE|nr:hypothetical protein AVEN_134355-1 [Araneus ventricosus]
MNDFWRNCASSQQCLQHCCATQLLQQLNCFSNSTAAPTQLLLQLNCCSNSTVVATELLLQLKNFWINSECKILILHPRVRTLLLAISIFSLS